MISSSPWHLERLYRVASQAAQHAFWGEHALVQHSMLHQLALATA
jgi:hypothetical protein